MSESCKERSKLGGGACGGRGGDNEDDGGDRKNENENEHGCENCGKGGKRVALFRFRKVKKPFQRRNKKSNYASNIGKRVCGGSGGSGCYFCLKQPQTLDSPGVSQTRDPNNPGFTYEMLGPVIEKNDFYSKECNTHLDDI